MQANLPPTTNAKGTGDLDGKISMKKQILYTEIQPLQSETPKVREMQVVRACPNTYPISGLFNSQIALLLQRRLFLVPLALCRSSSLLLR